MSLKTHIIQNANIHFGEIIDEDIHTKFKRKFEYADFLIDLTIIKNFLLKIYNKQLKELEEFRKKLSILKKDIIFLETILNNSEDDIFCFLEKLMRKTDFDDGNKLNKNQTNSEKNIRKEQTSNNKMKYEEVKSQKRTNENSNLKDNNEEQPQNTTNNKRIKLSHLNDYIDLFDGNIELESQLNGIYIFFLYILK
ncbi:hypothetical protein PIROE2DRAFT_58970 [Piromyces sp. E2]|nr:hypothetical protein PIROE2DRAFT_58970 [Piromyces sp. E2]|eukprot:OUM67065.1 hypothetical protein PIROE2DRAFT_58970 [Piromyces sp. E2]